MNKTRTALLLVASLIALIAVAAFTGCSKSPKPSMPVIISIRGAALDNSLVAQFRNVSTRHLAVVVRIENRTLNQAKDGFIELPPGETREIRWMQGRKFVPGE